MQLNNVHKIMWHEIMFLIIMVLTLWSMVLSLEEIVIKMI